MTVCILHLEWPHHGAAFPDNPSAKHTVHSVTAATVQFRNVAKRFGDKAMRNDGGFGFENGAFGLVGMNGVSKTAPIKNFADVIRPPDLGGNLVLTRLRVCG